MNETKTFLGVFGVGCLGFLMVLCFYGVAAFVVVWAAMTAAKMFGFTW